MRNLIFLMILAIFVGSCRSKKPAYQAMTKKDLSELCVLEFTYKGLPIKTNLDTLIINNIERVIDSVDCTGKEGIQYMPRDIPRDTVYITKTEIVPDDAGIFFIEEQKKEIQQLTYEKDRVEKEAKKTNRENTWLKILIGVAIGTGGFLAIKRFF